MTSLLHHFLGTTANQNPIAALAMDIEDLLNHTRSAQPWPTSQGASILNYGVPSWVGKPMSAIFLKELASQIKQAMTLFEPRIDPKSLQVKADPHFISALGVYKIDIRAKLKNTQGLSETVTDEIDWFIHIDPHYGVAKVQANASTFQLIE